MSKRDDIIWKEFLEYDENSPTCLRWIDPYRKGRGGKPIKRVNNGWAGSVSKNGSVIVYHEGWPYPAKEVVWEIVNGEKPQGTIWFVDGNPLNVKIGNLFIQEDIERSHKYDSFLADYLEYDETSPSCLRWKRRYKLGSNVSPGDIAGSLDTLDGYWKLHGLSDHFKVHKIVWALHNDFQNQTGKHIDHLNGVRSDNRIENLRLVAPELNARNQGLQKNNKTGVNGVAFSVVKTKCGNYTERYVATAALDGKKKTKAFSPFVYGYEQAFKLACEWREKMIAEFNEQGAGYTERHGS